MDKDIRNRIKDLLKAKGYSILRLSGGNSALQVKLNNHINGETAISAATIELILTAFPDVSAEWLLRGTGDMFLWQSAIDNAERKDEGKELTESAGGASVAELRREIAELRKDKENLMLLLTQITKR